MIAALTSLSFDGTDRAGISPPEPTRIPARSARCCSAALRRAASCRHCSRATRGRKPKPSYSEERNTKTATVTATPTPTPKPAPIATPMPMLATAAPTPAPSTTPTNTLNGKAATPQREIFVPWLRFFPLTVIIPDTGLTRQYQSIRPTLRFSGGGPSGFLSNEIAHFFLPSGPNGDAQLYER